MQFIINNGVFLNQPKYELSPKLNCTLFINIHQRATYIVQEIRTFFQNIINNPVITDFTH